MALWIKNTVTWNFVGVFLHDFGIFMEFFHAVGKENKQHKKGQQKKKQPLSVAGSFPLLMARTWPSSKLSLTQVEH